ncbi:MAG TPA: bifunctional salicylyl-CoA 5-hydroxylase/oxidoreductase [Planctomycetota bacterium]|nr:bifunctional salicylyl-CoA 5-hydroxylase/oxidoreductase [Planctomycetota bacterium]
MKIACIGGGPAALYFALLLRQARPEVEIDVYEQNRSDDTFGWGVVFSDDTLSNFAAADPQSFAQIEQSFARWTDIETFVGGERVVSTGHGFCGLSRMRLLQILHRRCRELGVRLHFQTLVTEIDDLVAGHDLVVAADGVNSKVRERFADSFQPRLDWRQCKFAWFGTDLDLRAFTFVFTMTEWGLFQVHAYPFEPGRSTWIVECREPTWQRAGLDRLDEAASAAFCERLWPGHLRGHRLLTNKSVWRTFPTIRCNSWRHGNVVLVGDAAHTAHFSIGSGTKLAMEDAIALAQAVAHHGRDVAAALAAYEAARHVEVQKTQRAAQTSLEWFEHSERYLRQSPRRFVFNLMTRSRRITYDNLQRRDPLLVAAVTAQVAQEEGLAVAAGKPAPPPAFLPFQLRSLQLHNRVVVSPMCQYSATDGVPDEWHLVHLGSRAVGGAGLVFTEMTNVSAAGRITFGCTGIWNDAQAAAFARIVAFVHAHSRAKIGLQLAHAGRKGSCALPWQGDAPLREGGWPVLGPSALPFATGWHLPKQMDRGDMDLVREQFVSSTRLCDRAGFDVLELHMAHGYLLSSFLSPLSNQRGDAYGGPLAHRARFPLEVLMAVRAVWPAQKPLFVRLSATDWLEPRGFTQGESVEFARMLKDHGCDLIDVSTGGNSPESKPEYGRMYQVPFAERIKYEAGIPVMTVGGVMGIDHVNTIVGAGRADLCALARAHLNDPYLTLQAARRYGVTEFPWPDQYLPARP